MSSHVSSASSSSVGQSETAPAIAGLAASGCGLFDRLGGRELAADDLRDAVAAHRDAVEAVGGLHRALLVRDDDELRTLGVLAQEREEAVDVEVVERGFDL